MAQIERSGEFPKRCALPSWTTAQDADLSFSDADAHDRRRTMERISLTLCGSERMPSEGVDTFAPIDIWTQTYRHARKIKAWVTSHRANPSRCSDTESAIEAAAGFLGKEHAAANVVPAGEQGTVTLDCLEIFVNTTLELCCRMFDDAESAYRARIFGSDCDGIANDMYARIGEKQRPWSMADYNFLPLRDLRHFPEKDADRLLSFEPTGFVQTTNGMGYTTSCLDPFSSAFVWHVQDVPQIDGPVLEIGAAFGVAAIPALRAGASVVANDLSAEHLRALEQLTPKHLLPRLKTTAAHFPDGLHYEPETFSAILVSRVLHFLTVPQLLAGARLLERWLKPGGHLFVVEDSPYLGNVAAFTVEYEKRRAAGQEFPGMRHNVSEVFASRSDKLPSLFHFFDPDVLSQTFRKAGLEVINCRFFPRLDYPEDVQLDGREGVGMIARKPPR